MALIKCKECGHQVSNTAALCPGCGAKVPKQIGKFAWFILAIFAILVTRCAMTSDSSVTAPSPEQQILSEAKWACREAMEKSLKAPSTADFQNYLNFSAIPLAPNEYRVTGYVDAQNSYGAMIRTTFTCEVKRNASGGWLLASLHSQ